MKKRNSYDDFVLYHKIEMNIWKKKQQILNELSIINLEIDERILRRIIKRNNRLFNLHKRELYIAHNNSKGYIATNDIDIIKDSIRDNFKRSKDMLYDYGMTMKAINENYNLRMDLEGSGLFNEYKFLLNEVVNVCISNHIYALTDEGESVNLYKNKEFVKSFSSHFKHYRNYEDAERYIEDNKILVTGIITSIDTENEKYEVSYLSGLRHKKEWFKEDDIEKIKEVSKYD